MVLYSWKETEHCGEEIMRYNLLHKNLGMLISVLEKNTRTYKTWMSLMIPLVRPIVRPVAITIVTWTLFCFARFWKVGTDDTCENYDHSRPWLWVIRVDQYAQNHVRRLIIQTKHYILLFCWEVPCKHGWICLRAYFSIKRQTLWGKHNQGREFSKSDPLLFGPPNIS